MANLMLYEDFVRDFSSASGLALSALKSTHRLQNSLGTLVLIITQSAKDNNVYLMAEIGPAPEIPEVCDAINSSALIASTDAERLNDIRVTFNPDNQKYFLCRAPLTDDDALQISQELIQAAEEMRIEFNEFIELYTRNMSKTHDSNAIQS